MELKEDVIRTVYHVLFDNKVFEEECVEVDYDGAGDNQYIYALYVQDLDTLLTLLEPYHGKANFAIHYTTKKFHRKTPLKRSSKSNVYRCRAIIIDFEYKKKTRLNAEKFDQLYTEVKAFLTKYPELKNAVALVGYTGGGGQLYIQLSRWIENGEVTLILDYLKNIFSECRVIDTSTFNVAQGQRLLGTYSVKWKVYTDIVENRLDVVEPLDVDAILKALEIEEEITIKRTKEIEKTGAVIKNLNEAIEQIKQKVKFADLGYSGNYHGHYSKLSCPFHPPDNNPSFIVYHRATDGKEVDVGWDTHDNEFYDIISFYQKIYEKSFIDTIKDLAKKAGIKLSLDKQEAKKTRLAQKIEELNCEDYIQTELGIRDVKLFKTEDGLHFQFIIEDIYGERKEVEAHVKDIRQFKKAETFFLSHTYHIPEKLEQELWDTVLQFLINKAERPEDLEYDRETLHYEIEYLANVIYNAEGTDSINEFLANKATKYFEGDRAFLNINRLMMKLNSLVLKQKSIPHILNLLRKMGAVPCILQGKRAWLLPEDRTWRHTITEEHVEQIEQAVNDNDTQSDLPLDSYTTNVEDINEESMDF